MRNFQIADQRVAPPGHGTYGNLFFPLYTFLYHEFVLLQGGFGLGPTPYHGVLQSAGNLVMGQITGAILTGDGTLLNRGETNHWWAPWSPKAGSNDDSSLDLPMQRSSFKFTELIPGLSVNYSTAKPKSCFASKNSGR